MDQSLQNFLNKHVPGVSLKSAESVMELVAEGATVPFIARYRKEKTGNLDEVQIRAVIENHENYNEIVKRKVFLIKEIGEQGNLTTEIKKRIDGSWDLGELEEIYRPFKKKKKTKATIARDAGLEPLANWIWELGHGLLKDDMTMEVKAKSFINPAAKIITYEEALKGAQDIIIEKIANDPDLRALVASDYLEKGRIISKRTKNFKPHSKYEMYAEFEETVKSLLDSKASHRYLAMRRGWQEEELSLEIKGSDEELLKRYLAFATTNPDNAIGDFLAQSSRLALNVYVIPSVTNDIHRVLKDKADEDSIKVFAENVRKLLLASPFGPKCVLGVDPGLRTGCKVALIDKGGHFLSHTVLQILGDDAEKKAKQLFSDVLKQVQIDAIAVGNGTAGRQAEAFLRKVLKDLDKNIPVIMVNEAGASVYSASEIARTEFPDLDLTVKGAISIARRLQDPLAELVKVDPKSIGVGQYQHDVNQARLKKSLEAVVESCVNNVGVDLNTASAALLSYVSGLGPALSQNLVDYRKSKGLFTDRDELLKVPKFSSKVFEQAAGFLRIQQSKQVLDNTGIHPERYSAVKDMVHDLGLSLHDVIGEGAKKLLTQRTKWAALIGEYTFDDILRELEKPGRDPRDPFKLFNYREDIFEVKDLKEGMICPGIVTNVTNFGAFVDIGVHQDGLVHISELSNKFVEDPRKVVNPGDQVTVRVLKVDTDRNQISLTMKMEVSAESRVKSAESQRERRDYGSSAESRAQRGQGGRAQDRVDRGSEAKGSRPQAFQQGGGVSSSSHNQNMRGGSGYGAGGSSGGKRSDQGQKNHSAGRSGPTAGAAGGTGMNRKPAQPFNNPFAALLNNSGAAKK